MKTITLLAFVSLMLCSTGCISTKTVQKAQSTYTVTHKNEDGKVVEEKRARWGYYCLMPITVPLDVATAPFQAVLIFCATGMNSGWE